MGNMKKPKRAISVDDAGVISMISEHFCNNQLQIKWKVQSFYIYFFLLNFCTFWYYKCTYSVMFLTCLITEAPCVLQWPPLAAAIDVCIKWLTASFQLSLRPFNSKPQTLMFLFSSFKNQNVCTHWAQVMSRMAVQLMTDRTTAMMTKTVCTNSVLLLWSTRTPRVWIPQRSPS